MYEKSILLPDSRSFADLLEYLGEWDHETMSHRGDGLPLRNNRPPARYIPETTPKATAWEREAWRGDGRNEVGPFCTVDLSQIGGPAHRSIAVRATDAVIAAVAPRIVTPDDHLSFRIIGHSDGRALVILEHGYIIGSHWLAYIDLATIPEYPYSARDERISALCESLRENGRRPFRRNLPGGVVEISNVPDELPTISATVEPDGSAQLRWPDGSVTR